MLLLFTVLSGAPAMGLLVQCLCVAALAAICLCEYVYLSTDKPRLRDALNYPVIRKRPMFITYMRAYVLMATSICILAVDFQVFPRKFAKTENYGFSVMDSGVGIFVVVNGLTAPEIKTSSKRRFSGRLLLSVPLLVLGVFRLVLVKLSGYHEHVSEYGLYWNFFFTLAAVKMCATVLACAFPLRKAAWPLAASIAAGHEYLLTRRGLKAHLLSQFGATQRQALDWARANKEGLLSLPGYLALYLIGIGIGVFLQRTRTRLKSWMLLVVQLLFLSLVSYACLVVSCNALDLPSRRMANLSYVLWMLNLTFMQLGLFLAVEIAVIFGGAIKLPLYTFSENPFDQLEPNLWCQINKKGLAFFLLSNVLTGAVNFALPTISLEEPLSLAVLLLYSFVLSVIISLL